MRKNYVKPQMEVVKINQRVCLDTTSVNTNGVGITYGGGSSEGGRSRDCDDWDE